MPMVPPDTLLLSTVKLPGRVAPLTGLANGVPLRFAMRRAASPPD